MDAPSGGERNGQPKATSSKAAQQARERVRKKGEAYQPLVETQLKRVSTNLQSERRHSFHCAETRES